jgi:hypothetical protein
MRSVIKFGHIVRLANPSQRCIRQAERDGLLTTPATIYPHQRPTPKMAPPPVHPFVAAIMRAEGYGEYSGTTVDIYTGKDHHYLEGLSPSASINFQAKVAAIPTRQTARVTIIMPPKNMYNNLQLLS